MGKNKKEEKEVSCCEKIFAGIFIVIAIAAVLFGIGIIGAVTGQENIDIRLTQGVADEICMQLTGEDFVVASDDYYESGFGRGGNLICDVSSEDSAKGIIINR